MTTFKRASVGVAAIAMAVSAFLFTFTASTARVSAAQAYLPLNSLGYSAYVCRVGYNVRVVVSKPVNSNPTRAYLRSYTQPAEYPSLVWAESSSTAWWGNTVTVVEVPASNWYKLSLWEYDPVTGANVYHKTWSDFVATGYTPYC